MDNLVYKTVLTIILILIILYLLTFIILPYFSKSTEGLSVTENLNIANLNIANIANNNIYVTCYIGNTKYYLSIMPKKDCNNLKNITENECHSNIPVLITTPDKSCIFNINKIGNIYSLRSQMVSLVSPYLTQNLNYYSGVNLLCFDYDTKDEIIYFNANDVNAINNSNVITPGYNLMFVKNNNVYYVGVCSLGERMCDNLSRLCLYTDQTKATAFNFEIVETFDMESQYTKPENSVTYLNSEYSFGSVDSKNTLISLPGAGNIDNDHLNSFKLWNE